MKTLIDKIGAILTEHGCSCDCGHDYNYHDDDCELCTACRIEAVLTEFSQKGYAPQFVKYYPYFLQNANYLYSYTIHLKDNSSAFGIPLVNPEDKNTFFVFASDGLHIIFYTDLIQIQKFTMLTTPIPSQPVDLKTRTTSP